MSIIGGYHAIIFVENAENDAQYCGIVTTNNDHQQQPVINQEWQTSEICCQSGTSTFWDQGWNMLGQHMIIQPWCKCYKGS